MLRRSLALAALLLFPVVASAHGLDMTLRVANGSVAVTLLFDDDTPCDGAVVKLLNAAGEVVAEGKSDAKGVCVLAAPTPGEYTIRAKTDDGHGAKQPLTITADPTPTETVTSRPPRLLLLGVGLLALTVGFNLWYWLGRRKRPGPPAT